MIGYDPEPNIEAKVEVEEDRRALADLTGGQGMVPPGRPSLLVRRLILSATVYLADGLACL